MGARTSRGISGVSELICRDCGGLCSVSDRRCLDCGHLYQPEESEETSVDIWPREAPPPEPPIVDPAQTGEMAPRAPSALAMRPWPIWLGMATLAVAIAATAAVIVSRHQSRSLEQLLARAWVSRCLESNASGEGLRLLAGASLDSMSMDQRLSVIRGCEGLVSDLSLVSSGVKDQEALRQFARKLDILSIPIPALAEMALDVRCQTAIAVWTQQDTAAARQDLCNCISALQQASQRATGAERNRHNKRIRDIELLCSGCDFCHNERP
jgi:hypothetical protein